MPALTAPRRQQPAGFSPLGTFIGFWGLYRCVGLLEAPVPSSASKALYLLACWLTVVLAFVATDALWKCRSTARDAMSAFTAAIILRDVIGLSRAPDVTPGLVLSTGFGVLLFAVLPLVYVHHRSDAIFGPRRRASP